MQKQITKKTPLLENGSVTSAAGYATHMMFEYDKSQVKSRRLKEWDFYQIQFGTMVLQVTVGHISWCTQVSANLIDLETGKRRSVGCTRMGSRRARRALGQNPELSDTVAWHARGISVQFSTTPKYRHLSLTKVGKKGQIVAAIDLMLTNCSEYKDKMVIATPFLRKKQWYLNYKENCFDVTGHCMIDDLDIEIDNGSAVLDWGRGVWPRKHSWIWGNGSTILEDGTHFGFNIGWGFGDTSAATENMFFYDNKAVKLGVVQQLKIGDNYRYIDKEKNFIFDVEPIFDNFTRTKAPFVNNVCHQVFGKWHGVVTLPDGEKITVPEFIAFCEHSVNNW